jgi:ribosomal protein L40E
MMGFMITCPACGKENADSASECRRCRAPLREEAPPAGEAASSSAFGEVCRRCEAYNEPGTKVCTNCGLALVPGAGGEPPLDKTPEQPFEPPVEEAASDHTPPDGTPSVDDELSALALSPEEAAEAGISSARNRAPAAESAPAGKICGNCGAANPPAAKFCFDCGTPFFARKQEARPPPKVERTELPPTIQIAADLIDEESTSETAPLAADEAVDSESVAEPIEDETPPPFQASLIIEKGSAAGTAFALAHLENSLGSAGTRIELTDDAFIAPHAATLLFAEDRLLVRDEGSANGVFVKVRETAPLEAGDLFIAGERLFRYDGPFDLDRGGESDTPYLGAPRPPGVATVRITELLAGGKTGRTCHRSGPVIAIGKTGCDLNFSGDSLLAARHAEIRLGEEESATLADLGQAPAGVFLRVKGTMDLQAGDILMVGEQQFRVEVD